MSFRRGQLLKAFFDAFVLVAEALFEAQDFFADDREAEVPRLDNPGVYRADCDFVNAFAFDADKRVIFERSSVKILVACCFVTQGKVVRWPGAVAEPGAHVVGAFGIDSEQVGNGALHPPCVRKNAGKIWVVRVSVA